MRVKTDARRTAIVQAAWEVFRSEGFERATMSEISARAGGSKATLYGYFRSKEELFFAAIEEILQSQAEEAFDLLGDEGELRHRLTGFAIAYMRFRLEADLVAVERMLIAEAEQSNLCEVMRDHYVAPQWRRLANVLALEMDAGRMRRADPYRAAMHLRGLIETDIIDRRLHGESRMPEAAVEAEVKEGVDVFLRAYKA